MDLNPRFTNRSIRTLFEQTGIDLTKLSGEDLTDADKRVQITVAGMKGLDPDQVTAACEELTPGEHIEILTTAIRRDLLPSSLREAAAKAATPDKSE